MLFGAVMVQGVTVTRKVQVVEFFAASVAVQETEVAPGAKQVPEGGVQTTLTPEQLSAAVGVV